MLLTNLDIIVANIYAIFKGCLSFDWPAKQGGAETKTVKFNQGYGLTYSNGTN